jgi:hypothetical protein
MRFLTVLCASAFFGSFLAAQNSSQTSYVPEASTHVRIDGIRILPAPGKPFSGVDSGNWTRVLEDGSEVAMHYDAKLARDAQGRIYRERASQFPANSDQKSRVTEIQIMDPVAHTRTTCEVAARHCNITGYNARTSLPAKPLGIFGNDQRRVSRENIGNDNIDGLDVVGTRETLTLAAGVEGNSQALTIVEEGWYSPELEVNLTVSRKDPREGTVVVHVVDLSRSDPDPSLFQVPANFTVSDTRPSAKTEN